MPDDTPVPIEDLDDIKISEPDTTIEEELADIELSEPDDELLVELDEIENPDSDGTADFETFSGAFVPGIGDVYAAGGSFVVEAVTGPARGYPGTRLIHTDRGEFAYGKPLRVGARYQAVAAEGSITLETVDQSDAESEEVTDDE